MGNVMEWMFGWMGGGSKSKKAPAPTAMPAAPKVDNAASEAEQAARNKRRKQTRTIYTSPLGIGGEANIARKTLLGQ